MKCPYCNTKVTSNKCPKCKAVILMNEEPKAKDNKESEKERK